MCIINFRQFNILQTIGICQKLLEPIKQIPSISIFRMLINARNIISKSLFLTAHDLKNNITLTHNILEKGYEMKEKNIEI